MLEQFKESQIKDLTVPTLWCDQLELLQKARSLQTVLGSAQWDNFNLFDVACKNALALTAVKLDSKDIDADLQPVEAEITALLSEVTT